ncbi:photosystem II biogenesis protein Psp29 [Gloeothece citriformis PCC 7424]|uniref:Protein Thf1 n=1 Tax=Gloeothece citriformis (strain PCC 7424) TaxID=65393 RepID=THF1_GLOC7|nr:photosystem II biogenesis protein Psp29 [Gloeothece citriformis]B7KI38.1 RecName: Full=Protein Thf1 [Gloeothece citriformis PCC 7424]ACK73525.1 photosystem II biogenesis protein Psp29 [Gloeothece citriformis PCC 7424]
MDKVRTVSDSKRDFYTKHTRPINSVYRRVVEELMVEMHLLSVNSDFQYDPVYALGVVTSFQRFMQGYRPDADKESIFNALCQSVGGDPQQYRQDAERMIESAKQLSAQQLLFNLESASDSSSGENQILQTLIGIANAPKYKYTRLFAIGIYTILAETDPEMLKNTEKREEVVKQIAKVLHLPEEKMQKDLDLYRSNLEKMDQLLTVIEEALQADRKKREQQKIMDN